MSTNPQQLATFLAELRYDDLPDHVLDRTEDLFLDLSLIHI